jgi:hypothetical protein
VTAELTERNKGMLDQHIAGLTYRQIGAAHGMSAQAAHQVVQRTGRQHCEEVLANVHDAQDDGQDAALVLLMPQEPGTPEQRLMLRYVQFIEQGMRDLGADIEMSFHPAGYEGQMAVAFTDRAYQPSERITAP